MTTTAPQPLARMIADALGHDPSRPVLTYYDRVTGERTELSGATLGNWVSKTANLLSSDLGVGPGRVVAVALPPHWQTAAILLASWMVGAAVVDRVDDELGQDVVVCAEDRLMELADAAADEVVVTSLDPLARPVSAKPPHVLDYSTEVRAHGDTFAGVSADPDSPALHAGSYRLTYGSLAEVTIRTADRLGLHPGDRVLASTGVADVGPVMWLLAPICRGSSLVLVRTDDDPAAGQWLRSIADQEQVTATLDVDLDTPVGGSGDTRAEPPAAAGARPRRLTDLG